MSPFGPPQTGPWSTGLHGLVCRLYPTHRFKSKKGASVSEEFALFNWSSVGPPFGQSKYCQYLINRQGILKLN